MANQVAVAITSVAKAVEGLSKLLSQWLKGSDKRRTRKAIEAGEAYILRSKQIGRKNDSLLDKYEKDFFKYNN